MALNFTLHQLWISAISSRFKQGFVIPRCLMYQRWSNFFLKLSPLTIDFLTPTGQTKKALWQSSKKIWATIKNYCFPKLYWLLNRNPCNGLLQSPHNCVVFHPLYTLNNQGPFSPCSPGESQQTNDLNHRGVPRRRHKWMQRFQCDRQPQLSRGAGHSNWLMDLKETVVNEKLNGTLPTDPEKVSC